MNPRKLTLCYKQAEQSLWVYGCEKILLRCPTAEGLGLTQGAYLWIKSVRWSRPRPSDPQNLMFPFLMQAAWHYSTPGSQAVGRAVGQAACQGLARPEMALPCWVPVPRPQGFTGLWHVLISQWFPGWLAGFPGSLPWHWDVLGCVLGAVTPEWFVWQLPKGSEKSGGFLRLSENSCSGSTQAEYFAICHFLAQKKRKNLRSSQEILRCWL